MYLKTSERQIALASDGPLLPLKHTNPQGPSKKTSTTPSCKFLRSMRVILTVNRTGISGTKVSTCDF